MESISVFLDVTDPGLQKVLLMALVGAVFYGGYALLGKAKEKTTEIKANYDLKNDPNNVQALLDSAQIKMSNNDFSSAIDQFEKVLSIVPGNLDALINLGISYHMCKQYDKSEPFLTKTVHYLNSIGDDNKKGIQLAKKYGDKLGLALYFYGHTLHLKGNSDLADQYKEEALRVSSSFRNLNLY